LYKTARLHRHWGQAALPYETQHAPFFSVKARVEHDHKILKFYMSVSEDEHLVLMEETSSVFKIFKEKLLGKWLTGSLEKRLLDWLCGNKTHYKMRIY